jgi:integrase
MVTKHPKYTFKKGAVFYYSRVVPSDLIKHYQRKRIVLSLRTTSYQDARILSNDYSSKLDQYWLGLRLQCSDIPAIQLVQSSSVNLQSKFPTIEEAKELYFKVKGKNKPKLYFISASRNIRYVVNCLGNLPIDCYSTKDAAKFRQWLTDKGVSNSTLQRIFSSIKAIVNLCIQEQGLECSNPFAKVYLPSITDAKKRHPVSIPDLINLSNECTKVDDDIRHLVAIIINTGMRLSEALGLLVTDLHLNEKIPYVIIQPHNHRRLKTQASERIVPLLGVSLWAAKQIQTNNFSKYCFPRYIIDDTCKSNSASSTLNKWLKTIGNSNNVIHGIRHSWRDRLRNVDSPLDMVDQLGGWSLRSVGQSYGSGYSLETMNKYMILIAKQLET